MELNVIVRNKDNVVEKIIKLKYDAKKYDDLYDLANYLHKKYKVAYYLFYECEFDIDCKKNYIYSLAKKKNKLNLDIDFENLKFNDYFKITKSNCLTINSVLLDGGYGDGDLFLLLQIILFAWDLLKRVINFVKLLMVYIIPFYHLKKEYQYGENFIYDIIIRGDTWPYGFFELDKIKFNRLLEKSVMKKFGYKLNHKKWIKYVTEDKYRHLNKYNKF